MKANVEDRGIKGDCTPLMEAASGGYVIYIQVIIKMSMEKKLFLIYNSRILKKVQNKS
jgi:hypothetical protein